MLRLLADENFNRDIVRGLLRRAPSTDIVRVQDVGLTGIDDPGILEWAASESRVLLTHDVSTIPGFAFERVSAGRKMPGVVVMSSTISVGLAIDELLLLVECIHDMEWEGQVLRLPM
ncbi:MAG: DUF5615 family PIN-like protein [Tepidisphaeraceae bacterium]